MITRKWWQEVIVYQIYPRSFKDSDGDGIGDIPGIIDKIDYIKSLGVDVIWLSPIYKSPNDDNGYDISDYYSIMDEFGLMDDFDELLHKTHTLEMKLIMDLVVNHTSDEHFWFRESQKSKDNPYRDFYFWKKPQNGNPPNNWKSYFGGSVWEFDDRTEEYYLHLFSKKQPDLNWESPKVREEIYKIMKFWLDKGIDGFRMDVIPLISKRLGFEDSEYDNFGKTVVNYYANGPRVHEFIQEMNKEVLSKYNIMTVGEAAGVPLSMVNLYAGKDRNELNMIFQFDHVEINFGSGGRFDPQNWNLIDLKNIFNKYYEQLGDIGWPTVFLGNHDFTRIVSRLGNDGEYWEKSAKLIATFLLTMKGTVYLYQGDEIGMTNITIESPDDFNDVETINAMEDFKKRGIKDEEFMRIANQQGRDNARTPVQWCAKENAGFTEGLPWLKINPNHLHINIEDQESDNNSILNYYRKAIHLRKEMAVFTYGDYKSLNNEDPNIYIYERWDNSNKILVVLNFSSDNQRFYLREYSDLSDMELLLSNYDNISEKTHQNNLLEPWEARVYNIKY